MLGGVGGGGVRGYATQHVNCRFSSGCVAAYAEQVPALFSLLIQDSSRAVSHY